MNHDRKIVPFLYCNNVQLYWQYFYAKKQKHPKSSKMYTVKRHLFGKGFFEIFPGVRKRGMGESGVCQKRIFQGASDE